MNQKEIRFSGPHFEGSLLDLAEALHYFDRFWTLDEENERGCADQAIPVVFEGLGHCVDDPDEARVTKHTAVHFGEVDRLVAVDQVELAILEGKFVKNTRFCWKLENKPFW
jgi:hypothetical protein